MREIYWENQQWAARYLMIDTPFGILTQLVPGSLKRKEEPRILKEPEGRGTERSVRQAA